MSSTPENRLHPEYEAALASLPLLNCGGCTLCCRGDTITILPALDGSHKRWKTDKQPDGSRTLKRNADGECVYLRPTGCGIHGKAPTMCRVYDCRAHYLLAEAHPNPQRLAIPSIQRGKALLGVGA